MRRGVRLALLTAGFGISHVQAQKGSDTAVAPEPEPTSPVAAPDGGAGKSPSPAAPPAAPGCAPNPCHHGVCAAAVPGEGHRRLQQGPSIVCECPPEWTGYYCDRPYVPPENAPMTAKNPEPEPDPDPEPQPEPEPQPQLEPRQPPPPPPPASSPPSPALSPSPGPPATPEILGDGLAHDVDSFHQTVESVDQLNDDVNAAEDGLNTISTATGDTADLLPGTENATEIGFGNRTGCFVEYLGASWSSKSAELEGEEEVLEAETEDKNRVAKGTVMGVVYFLVGVLFLFYGAKFFKTVLFMVGFVSAGGSALAGFSVVVAVINGLDATMCPDCCQYLLVATLFCATLGGLLALWLLKLAYMTIGGACGGAIGYVSYLVYFHTYSLGDGTANRDGMYWLCIAIGAMLGALIAVKRDRSLTIFATSLLGSLLVIIGFDAIVFGNFYGGAHLDASVENVPKLKKDPYVQGMMLAWPMLALVGGLCQRKRKKNIDVAESSHGRDDVESFEMQDAIRLNGKIYVASPGAPLEAAGTGARNSKQRTKHHQR